MSTVIHTSAWDDQVDAKNGRAVLALLETIEMDRVEALVIETAIAAPALADKNASPSAYPGMVIVPDCFRVSTWSKPSQGQVASDMFGRTTVIGTYRGWDNVSLAAASIAHYFDGVPVWDWTQKAPDRSVGAQHEPVSYPVSAARGATDTSHEAARSIDLAVPHLQRIALLAIRTAGARGLTTHELARAVNIHRDVIQPRTSELRERGLIRDSGGRRQNFSGKFAIVWIAGGPA